MGIHLADQVTAFLQSILVGALLGMLYDIFRISRIAFPHSRAVIFVEDILFFLICGFATFLFLMSVIDGKLRSFLMIGELIGAVLYYFTLGQLVMRVATVIIGIVKSILLFLLRWILQPIWRLLLWIVNLLLRPLCFLGKILKKSAQKLRFRLKVGRILLYNQGRAFVHARRSKKRRKKEPPGNDSKAEEP